jgi:hypothetical protein
MDRSEGFKHFKQSILKQKPRMSNMDNCNCPTRPVVFEFQRRELFQEEDIASMGIFLVIMTLLIHLYKTKFGRRRRRRVVEYDSDSDIPDLL